MKKISSKARTVFLTSLTLFALFSTMMASFAWFLVVNPNSKLDTVSGDMSISFSKVSAVRYVYPFYASSNSFIDYSKEGSIKEYVLSDPSPEFTDESITIKNVDSSLTRENYYLVGNKTFVGLSSAEDFDFANAYILSSSADGMTFSAEEVTLSSGSQFVITDRTGNILSLSKSSLSLPQGIEYDTSNHSYKVSKAMMVSFSLKKGTTDSSSFSLNIESGTRTDSAILGMTLFDPTLAKLNGQDSQEKLPEAVYDQNTCLVYRIDVDIKSGTRDFILNCEVKRKEITTSDAQTSNKDEYYLSHYLTYRVSDDLGNSSSFDYFHPEDISKKSQYNKDSTTKSFSSISDTSLYLYQKSISNPNEKTSLTLYIAVDYNPENLSHFFTEENLGKEKINMVRDFTFYFSCRQVTKENSSSSSRQEISSENRSSSEESA